MRDTRLGTCPNDRLRREESIVDAVAPRRPVDGPGGVHEPDVRQGLREVAEQPAGAGVDLLGQQVDIVAVIQHVLERCSTARSSSPARARQSASRNEVITNAPSSFAPVQRRTRPRSASSSSTRRSSRACGRPPRRRGPDRHQQHGRVEVVRTERTGVGVALRAPAARGSRCASRRGSQPTTARRPPRRSRRQPHRPVERGPAAELGGRVVAFALASLPDAAVRLPPVLGRGADGQQGMCGSARAGRAGRASVHRVEHLTQHVDLALTPRSVADAHRPAARWPSRWSSSRSARSRSPSTPKMICRSLPARPPPPGSSRLQCGPPRPGTRLPTAPSASGWRREARRSGSPSWRRRRQSRAVTWWAPPRWRRSGRR